MEHKFETDIFPVIKAKWFTKSTGIRTVRVIVIHTMEAPKKADTAENVAKFFQTLPATRKASAHLCIDNDSIVQCVFDNDVAFAAPGVNRDGIQLELAGFASQTAADWKDAYNTLLLEKAANAAAQYCLKYDIPREHLTNKQLKDGAKGIIGHVQATKVFPPNAGHTDPGENFPWNFFIERVKFHYEERKKRLENS